MLVESNPQVPSATDSMGAKPFKFVQLCDPQLGMNDYLGFNHAVNTRARIRHITPRIDRVVDFPLDRSYAQAREYRKGSLVEGIVRDDFIIPALPIDISPSGLEAKAWFYQHQYGDYLIGMNTTGKDAYNASLYELDVPGEHRGKTVLDLVSGREVNLSNPVIIGPRSTMVLYVGGE